MKRVITSAVKRGSFDHTRGRLPDRTYTGADDVIQMLLDAGFGDLGWLNSRVDEDTEVLHEDISFISGPAELVVTVNAGNSVGDLKILKDGATVLSATTRGFMRKRPEVIKAYESMARAEASSFSRISDPKYQREKARKDRINKNKSYSASEIARCISVYGLNDKQAEEAIRKLRYDLTDDDWANMVDWSLEGKGTETESWASLAVQGYGYHYTTTAELDTGRNKYVTKLYKTEGWHTE